jgi:hypothetical protein
MLVVDIIFGMNDVCRVFVELVVTVVSGFVCVMVLVMVVVVVTHANADDGTSTRRTRDRMVRIFACFEKDSIRRKILLLSIELRVYNHWVERSTVVHTEECQRNLRWLYFCEDGMKKTVRLEELR